MGRRARVCRRRRGGHGLNGDCTCNGRTRDDESPDKESSDKENQALDKENRALALKCLCKMVSLLDGDFAQQVVSAGGLQCLAGAVICGDAEQASQAQSALLCIREKLPSASA